MKKLFLILMLTIPIGVFAQSHNLWGNSENGITFKDSVRFVTDSTHFPIQDSIHVIDLRGGYEYALFALMKSTSGGDSIKLTNGFIGYDKYHSKVDTTWGDEVNMRDSSWSFVVRAISTTVNAKVYTIFPLGDLLKIELVNYREATPTRVANYRLRLIK